MHLPVSWPEGKTFAFSIFDDCDFQTSDNARAVYDFLTEIGLRTTKAVWTELGSERPGEKVIGGATCEDEAYLRGPVVMAGSLSLDAKRETPALNEAGCRAVRGY